ncbi:MAG: autotransporter outer membrane beta-barrel domain-containing protein, partial [Rhizobiaceae bacterium]
GQGWAVTGVENTTLHVVNSGRIATAGDVAISFGRGTDYLKLLEGSVIIGDVDFETPDNDFLSFGPGLSAAVQMHDGENGHRSSAFASATDASQLNVTSAAGAHVVVNNTVYAADLTDYVARTRVQSQMIGAVQDATAMRHANGEGGWASGFGSGMRSSGESDFAAFDAAFGGFVIGSDLENGGSMFLGATFATSETSNGSAFETDSIGGFVGIDGTLPDSQVGYSVTIGAMHNETTRQVADNTIRSDGLDESSAKYWSAFFSPAVSVSGESIDLPEATLGVRYAGFWHDSHRFDFTESSADLSVDTGFSHFIEASASDDIALSPEWTLTPGLAVTWSDAGSLDLNLAGVPISADIPGDEVSGRLFVAARSSSGGFVSLSVTKFFSDDDPSFSGGAGFRF